MNEATIITELASLCNPQGNYSEQTRARVREIGQTMFREDGEDKMRRIHKEVATRALKKMAALGFFGNVGIDAMIWGNDILHPIVEINARKTMGWIALQIAKRLFPNQTIQVSYGAADHAQGLLPQGIIKLNGEVVKFHRNLLVNVLA